MSQTQERRTTLLLVDDNPTNLMLVRNIIELDLPQVKILTARSAKEGLKMTTQEQVDGAFIDVQMPQLSGLDMCRELRARKETARIPLVLMTAHTASPEMRAEGLEVGAYDFISQPISNIEMLARIKVMLRMCENERLLAQRLPAPQSGPETNNLRWIEGLLISGDGTLSAASKDLLERFSNRQSELSNLEPEHLLRLLVNEFPLPWRQTLFKLSLICRVPLSLAHQLSEIHDIAAMFGYLKRHGLVHSEVSNNQEFLAFSPELCDFLTNQADQHLEGNLRRQTLITAAEWFRYHKDFGRALGCLIRAEAYDETSQLLSQVGFLLLNNNFSTLVAPIIAQIPERILVGCGWMALFQGIREQCNDGRQSSIWLELAYQRFLADDDRRGQLLALSKQVQQTLCFDGDFENWTTKKTALAKLAEDLLPSLTDFEQLKVSYSYGLAELFFNGNLVLADKLVTKALIDAQQKQLIEPQVELFYLHSLLSLQQGRFLVATSSLEQGMKLANQCKKKLANCLLQMHACELLKTSGDVEGFLLQQELLTKVCAQSLQQNSIALARLKYFQALLHISRGEWQIASEITAIALLNGVTATHEPLHSSLVQLRGWIRAQEGKTTAALEDMENALQQRRKLGADICCQENLLLSAITCYTLGKIDKAADFLQIALDNSLQKGEERLRSGIYAWSVLIYAKKKQPEQAIKKLHHFCDLLRRQQTVYFWGMTPEAVEQLLEIAREQDLSRQLLPLLHVQSASLDEQQRKIPQLKVFCLGRFQLQLKDQVFDMSQVGQPSRQIFAALLTAPDKTVSIEQLMGQLWPESTSTKARNNFDAAHSRLRRSLEGFFGEGFRDTYLILEKGMLSLHHIQIDSLDFIAAIESSRLHLQREHLWQAELQLWKMDKLWQGGFLAGFDLLDELESVRNNLVQIRIQQLSVLAQLLDRRGQYPQAVELLKKGLQIEPGHEQLVRQLLSLYQKSQNTRAGTQLLEHYRQALINEDYDSDEIEELVDSLGAQWIALNINSKNKERLKNEYL
jgi:DNA-binding response OmpR family regulator